MKASQLLRTSEEIYKELKLSQIDDENELIEFESKVFVNNLDNQEE